MNQHSAINFHQQRILGRLVRLMILFIFNLFSCKFFMHVGINDLSSYTSTFTDDLLFEPVQSVLDENLTNDITNE